MIVSKYTYLSTGCLQVFNRTIKVIVILIACCFFLACSANHRQAPVSSRAAPPSTKIAYHVVAPGETLYAIAWRYGLDYKTLAKDNGIGRSYSIFPGQIINLSPPLKSISHNKPKPKSSASSPVSSRPKPVNTRPRRVKKATSTATAPAKVVKKTASPRSEKKSIRRSPSAPSTASAGKIRWRWPVGGKVLTNFKAGNALKRGIDIGGKKGDSITAAAAGQVIYAGGGLRGYGKLIIIKHNNTYLSAYAHNSELRVKEGEQVKAGQHIADMGATGMGANSKPKLHFQIRRNGKPVNPLPLLPRR